eukprot:TRINITY_DN7976_c0_g1_i1.p1 TRINITY_DN7976_c0_g1~~TRINITY_DN7976_c0_g1_i1.p1  ORF type:complete len:503 (-),score=74.23 TRINITY_DN7976_c0_g1_i1:76-1584(-)
MKIMQQPLRSSRVLLRAAPVEELPNHDAALLSSQRRLADHITRERSSKTAFSRREVLALYKASLIVARAHPSALRRDRDFSVVRESFRRNRVLLPKQSRRALVESCQHRLRFALSNLPKQSRQWVCERPALAPHRVYAANMAAANATAHLRAYRPFLRSAMFGGDAVANAEEKYAQMAQSKAAKETYEVVEVPLGQARARPDSTFRDTAPLTPLDTMVEAKLRQHVDRFQFRGPHWDNRSKPWECYGIPGDYHPTIPELRRAIERTAAKMTVATTEFYESPSPENAVKAWEATPTSMRGTYESFDEFHAALLEKMSMEPETVAKDMEEHAVYEAECRSRAARGQYAPPPPIVQRATRSYTPSPQVSETLFEPDEAAPPPEGLSREARREWEARDRVRREHRQERRQGPQDRLSESLKAVTHELLEEDAKTDAARDASQPPRKLSAETDADVLPPTSSAMSEMMQGNFPGMDNVMGPRKYANVPGGARGAMVRDVLLQRDNAK